ncbi:carotenoid biosynthesis protein [Alkalihalobacterium bogoriense]|uniref:carotenoid biosynthesis protein n=1 Tax=Alkalihalobacterium bogoriense TaxID=246272 RepID=UPI00047CADAF|nr:carotenoid biosynthesis protein [Alkalihalobacterium bogoriense]
MFSQLIFRFFIFWYSCGLILLTFDLLPPWLEWANTVFLLLTGLLGAIFFVTSYGYFIGLLISFVVVTGTIFAEWVGVTYGILFGHYFYNADFGPKIIDVPITIGFAWLMVIATTHVIGKTISQHLFTQKWKQIALYLIISPVAAVVMDLILDPVAYKVKQYWEWDGTGLYYGIPITNFVDWFIISLFLHIILVFLVFHRPICSHAWASRMVLLYALMVIMFMTIAAVATLWFAVGLSFVCTSLLLVLYFYSVRKKSVC